MQQQRAQQIRTSSRGITKLGVLAAFAGSLTFVGATCNESDVQEKDERATLKLRETCANPGQQIHIEVDRSGSCAPIGRIGFAGGTYAPTKLTLEGTGFFAATVPETAQSGAVYLDACNAITNQADLILTVPCPANAGGDAGGDSGPGTDPTPNVTGPSCGFVVMDSLATATQNNHDGKAAFIAGTGGTGATELDAFMDGAASPIAVGTCGTPTSRDVPDGLLDLGEKIAIQDGTSKLAELTRQTDSFYRGYGGTPPLPYGKALDLTQGSTRLGAQTTSIGNFPAEFTITAPMLAQGSPVTVTKGQPITFTWTPPSTPFTSVYALFGSKNLACSFDPASGTGTVPGSVTSTFDVGPSGVSVIAVKAGKSQISVNGTQCALRTAFRINRGGPIVVQ